MVTKVRDYSNGELLTRVKSLKSFQGFPGDFWIIGVQSEEDTFNEFDDKFYLFRGKEFIMVTTGTTNAGTTGLLHYDRYRKDGVAVVKTDEIYYSLWKYGLHKNRMPALKQYMAIKYFRDWNKNRRVEEIGTLYTGWIGINFHTVTYQKNVSLIKKLIGGWSTGCQVVNNTKDYYKMLDYTKHQYTVTYCLLKEF